MQLYYLRSDTAEGYENHWAFFYFVCVKLEFVTSHKKYMFTSIQISTFQCQVLRICSQVLMLSTVTCKLPDLSDS